MSPRVLHKDGTHELRVSCLTLTEAVREASEAFAEGGGLEGEIRGILGAVQPGVDGKEG